MVYNVNDQRIIQKPQTKFPIGIIFFVLLLILIPTILYLLVQYGILPTGQNSNSGQIPRVSITTQPTRPAATRSACTPRPACLNDSPPCQVPVPVGGWCPINPQVTGTFQSQPTATNSGQTLLVNTVLPGIGPSGNEHPIEASRDAELSFYYATSAAILLTKTDALLRFNGSSYQGTTSINLHPASYIVKIKLDNTLTKALPNPVQIIPTQTFYTLPPVTLSPGDLNNDNVIDSGDFDTFSSCLGNSSCTKADFNEDGSVDQIDYNILLRSSKTPRGD